MRKLVFLKGNADWLSQLPAVVKQYNNTIHHSIRMALIEAFKKINEKVIFTNLHDKRKKPKCKLG